MKRNLYRRTLRAYAWLLVTCTGLYITLSGGNSTEWGWLRNGIEQALHMALLA